jgi:hypothetical protein
MEYIIVSNDSIAATLRQVNEHIQQGWQALGGVTFCKLNHCHQAMCRELKNANAKRPTKPAAL